MLIPFTMYLTSPPMFETVALVQYERVVGADEVG